MVPYETRLHDKKLILKLVSRAIKSAGSTVPQQADALHLATLHPDIANVVCVYKTEDVTLILTKWGKQLQGIMKVAATEVKGDW